MGSNSKYLMYVVTFFQNLGVLVICLVRHRAHVPIQTFPYVVRAHLLTAFSLEATVSLQVTENNLADKARCDAIARDARSILVEDVITLPDFVFGWIHHSHHQLSPSGIGDSLTAVFPPW
jgi:hypothetical protein